MCPEPDLTWDASRFFNIGPIDDSIDTEKLLLVVSVVLIYGF